MSNCFSSPDLGIGIGLRSVHYKEILAKHLPIDWFEVLSENYIDTSGRPLSVLDQVAERYPVALASPCRSAARTRSTSPIWASSRPWPTARRHSGWEFLACLAADADCALLLDVNNVYVSSFNHGFDPNVYVDAIPADRVVQYHVAGHTHKGTHIIDTHSDHAIDEVWALYRRAWARTGPTATLYEWDENIPELSVVHAEALKARGHREPARATGTHGA